MFKGTGEVGCAVFEMWYIERGCEDEQRRERKKERIEKGYFDLIRS